MSTSQGADSGPIASPPESEFTEYVVRRDKDGPFVFAGVRLAKATRESTNFLVATTLEAAMYKTRGGKFITSLSKSTQSNNLANMLGGGDVEAAAGPDNSGYNKAAVHESFDGAVNWFRPGRLTDDIRKQLGLDQPVRIE